MALLPPDPLYIIRNVDNIGVYSLKFHVTADGKERLLAGSKDGFIYVYNMKTNRIELSVHVSDAPILHMIHLRNQLITQIKGGIFKVYNLTPSGYEQCLSFENDYSGFCHLVIDKNEEILYTPDNDMKIHMFSLYGDDLGCLKYNDENIKLGEVMCLKYLDLSQQKHCIIGGYESGWLLLWDLTSKAAIGKLKTKECPLTVEYNLERNKGVVGNTSKTIQVFRINLDNFSLVHLTDIIITNPGINKVLSKNHKVFVTAGWDGNVRIFSWASFKPLAVLNQHKESVQDIAFSPYIVSVWNSNLMAIASLDGSISLWDVFNK